MERQPRIVISQTTRWPWLVQQLMERRGQTFLIVGKGGRARHLIERLAREVPEPMQVFVHGDEYIGIVNPYGEEGPVAWGHDSRGKAPTVELTSNPRSTPAK